MRQEPPRNQNLLLVTTGQVLHQFLHARRLGVHALVGFLCRLKALAFLQDAVLCKTPLRRNNGVVLD